MSATTAARRYARALLDLCLDGSGQDPENVRAALREALALLHGQPDLHRALTHPAVSADAKRKMATAVWGGRGSNLLVERLLILLAERGRVALLPPILERFSSLWNQHRNVVSAEAVSAVALDPVQETGLSTAIANRTGMGVELSGRVDPALLGGVLVRFGGRTYDGSVRAQLRTLRQRLVAGT